MMLYLALTLSACLAAAGQVLLKLGANGQSDALGMLNLRVFGGLALYGFGVLIWLWALSQLPLQVVYPFSLLTLILVFIASIAFFGERPSGLLCLGWAVVGLGIMIVAYAGARS
jgi:drug/metabolite transporter (DMT)-like permease